VCTKASFHYLVVRFCSKSRLLIQQWHLSSYCVWRIVAKSWHHLNGDQNSIRTKFKAPSMQRKKIMEPYVASDCPSRLWKITALFVAGTRKLCCVCNKKVDALAIQASDVRKVWCFYFFQIFVNCQFVSHASEATKKQPGHLISHQSFSCDR